jgi:hypothetical protein
VAVAARAAAALSEGESLLRAQPPSLAQSRQRAHDAAGEWDSPLVRALRLAYGYLYLAIRPALLAADWLLESPPRLLVAALVIVIWIFWA